MIMFTELWDMLVFITNNYSKMPKDFKDQFPEAECIKLRLSISSIEAAINGYEGYEE